MMAIFQRLGLMAEVRDYRSVERRRERHDWAAISTSSALTVSHNELDMHA